MVLSADAQAMLLLCSHLGLPPRAQPAPLTLREWNPLARKLHGSPLRRPGALLEQPWASVKTMLDLGDDLAERLEALLQRGGTLAIELERLEALGIWVMTRADEDYPVRLRTRLKEAAPTILFGCGPRDLIGQPGLAVVGSRKMDESAKTSATWFGQACAAAGLVLYSGGARGVDEIAMTAALEGQGKVVGVLAESLEKAIRDPNARAALAEGRLTFLTPYVPRAGFTVGAAMGRNKLIYALADYALVVASEAYSGGTWAGAVEALRGGWVPVFVCSGPGVPEGNRLLVQHGAIALPVPFQGRPEELMVRLAEYSVRNKQPNFPWPE